MIDRPANHPAGIAVPYTELSAQALRGLIESFVLREGTDYGLREYSLEQKVTHVLKQLERGEVHILFEGVTETVTIVPTSALPAQDTD